MNFKTVNGLGKAEYVKKAVNTALDKGMSPDYVTEWGKWFDRQSGDPLPPQITQAQIEAHGVEKLAADNPVMFAAAQGVNVNAPAVPVCARCVLGSGSVPVGVKLCRRCVYEMPTLRPAEPPAPKYYRDDLVEVATKIILQLESWATQAGYGGRYKLPHNAFATLIQDLKRPGYIEDLLP